MWQKFFVLKLQKHLKYATERKIQLKTHVDLVSIPDFGVENVQFVCMQPNHFGSLEEIDSDCHVSLEQPFVCTRQTFIWSYFKNIFF
jgi:hypothetical protein